MLRSILNLSSMYRPVVVLFNLNQYSHMDCPSPTVMLTTLCILVQSPILSLQPLHPWRDSVHPLQDSAHP